MHTVTVYRFNEFGSSMASHREVSEDDRAAVLEEAVAESERQLGRTRVPYDDEYIGAGFKVGSGDDANYHVITCD